MAAAASLIFFMMSMFIRSAVTASWRSTSAFHWAFDKPGGLAIGALSFLCFGWTAPLVARRGATYFFHGMAGGFRERMEGAAGEKWLTIGKMEGTGEENDENTYGVADSAGPRAFLH